jgi:predicted CoA-binding protein
MPNEDAERLLLRAKTIAVVGCSTQPGKAAHEVPRYMKDQGYRIIPVHPSADEVLGQRAYPSLAAISERIDLVNVFRPSHEAPAIVEAAIAKGAPAVWLQQGIVHEGAAARARAAGLAMVMDLCIMQAHQRLMASRP